MAWWAWLVAGLVLFALEAMSAGGFYVVFFGAGAVVVAILDLLGWHVSLLPQGLLFVGISLVALALFRRPLLARFQKGIPTHKVDSLAGQMAKALEDIPVGGRGTAELRGSSWSAQNVGTILIPRDARCHVDRVEGLTLYLRG
jgi:membrane protein implicated in regulation of membrane protease activity